MVATELALAVAYPYAGKLEVAVYGVISKRRNSLITEKSAISCN
jgi:hypothetical protein